MIPEHGAVQRVCTSYPQTKSLECEGYTPGRWATGVRGGVAAVAEDLEPLPSISLASKAPKAVYDKNAISDDEDSDE